MSTPLVVVSKPLAKYKTPPMEFAPATPAASSFK